MTAGLAHEQRMKCTRLFYDVAQKNEIHPDIFREVIVVQYRAFKLTEPEAVAAIEKCCDIVDQEAKPLLDLLNKTEVL